MPRSGWSREPQLLSLRVWSLCSATREAATVLDFSITDLTSETDEIPDIIALEEENGPNHSHANGPQPSQGKMLNN
ncbi:hypothetical protein J1605_001276 [Eschrichtius robustus]|uniref:Uncharacterized protein n=1 Tax=Eschrichtius robustus TaxID=9764 RepID=A0AB34G788_ESCRO|nr:hypothetical protein J1605_001276 [Eschrichtius robustus]